MKTLWIVILFFVYSILPLNLGAQFTISIEEAKLLWEEVLPGNYIWFPDIEEEMPEPLDGCYVVPVFGIGQRLLRDLWFIEDYEDLGLDIKNRPKARYVQVKPPSNGEAPYGFDQPSFLELIEIITLMDYVLANENFILIRDDLLSFISNEQLAGISNLFYKNYLFYHSDQIPSKPAGHLFVVSLPDKEGITPLKVGSNALSYIDDYSNDIRLKVFSNYATIPRKKRSFNMNEVYIK